MPHYNKFVVWQEPIKFDGLLSVVITVNNITFGRGKNLPFCCAMWQ